MLTSKSKQVLPDFHGELRFDFPKPLKLTPGKNYWLRLEETFPIFFWLYDARNPYPDGEAWFGGHALICGDGDFRFKLFDDCQKTSITGRWRTLETSKGGIGATFEFKHDGIVDFGPGAVVPSSYRVEGNELVFPEGRQTIEWVDDNRLRLKAGSAVLDLKRFGARTDTTNPILGE